MLKTTNEIPTYDDPATPSVRVHNHWNDSRMVVLEIGKEKVTVSADDLNAAVKNATNTNRW